MASRRYLSLAAILITISLDISSVAAATIAQDPKISRYDSYNLDKGPVFYEAYYPDYPHDTYQEKRNLDRDRKVLETSFQVPFERLAYSEIADRPVIFDDDKTLQTANIEEISKLVRRAISRDLENWNILERYLDRVSIDQNWPMQQKGLSRESRENKEDNSYPFQDNRRQFFDLSRQSNLEILRKLEARDARQRFPNYFEEIDADGNAMTKKMSDIQPDDAPSINVASGSLLTENIFQPRPQIIRYTFFKKPTARLEQQPEKVIDNSTPRNYGDNLIRQEIADKNNVKESNVKVTSIEVSEFPRHKTRHHHGEWPKRDYSIHRHQSEEIKSKDA
ncbi:uncharacterized protein [Anoplolepis gracilipes]|uniref:uncharacterized protein n=1 Tax=Anoplolepis gracilipes TaxID=354296 RepID=UPI003BA19F3A